MTARILRENPLLGAAYAIPCEAAHALLNRVDGLFRVLVFTIFGNRPEQEDVKHAASLLSGVRVAALISTITGVANCVFLLTLKPARLAKLFMPLVTAGIAGYGVYRALEHVPEQHRERARVALPCAVGILFLCSSSVRTLAVLVGGCFAAVKVHELSGKKWVGVATLMTAAMTVSPTGRVFLVGAIQATAFMGTATLVHDLFVFRRVFSLVADMPHRLRAKTVANAIPQRVTEAVREGLADAADFTRAHPLIATAAAATGFVVPTAAAAIVGAGVARQAGIPLPVGAGAAAMAYGNPWTAAATGANIAMGGILFPYREVFGEIRSAFIEARAQSILAKHFLPVLNPDSNLIDDIIRNLLSLLRTAEGGLPLPGVRIRLSERVRRELQEMPRAVRELLVRGREEPTPEEVRGHLAQIPGSVIRFLSGRHNEVPEDVAAALREIPEPVIRFLEQGSDGTLPETIPADIRATLARLPSSAVRFMDHGRRGTLMTQQILDAIARKLSPSTIRFLERLRAILAERLGIRIDADILAFIPPAAIDFVLGLLPQLGTGMAGIFSGITTATSLVASREAVARIIGSIAATAAIKRISSLSGGAPLPTTVRDRLIERITEEARIFQLEVDGIVRSLPDLNRIQRLRDFREGMRRDFQQTIDQLNQIPVYQAE